MTGFPLPDEKKPRPHRVKPAVRIIFFKYEIFIVAMIKISVVFELLN
jgi:hypothetical protein